MIPIGRRRCQEFLFGEYFALGKEESASPFLSDFARRVSRNLPLKVSLLAALFLCAGYLFFAFLNHPEIGYIFLAATFLLVGTPSLIQSVEDVVERKDINIDVLMTLAAFSSIAIGSGFEGALLLVLFSLSGAIEEAVAFKAKSALLSIHSLVPLKAYVLQDGRILERAVQDVEIGTVILVRAGEIVPLDGVVIEGTSDANFAHLTGESVPLRKTVGDEVASGARLIDSSLTLRVTHKSSDSTVSKIVSLITKAQSARPKLEKTFDRFGRVYAASIISFSLFVALTFPSLVGISFLGNEGSIYRALAFLITASPCALILAVPIAYLSSLGVSARKGIVLKGGVVIDALNSCTTIAFDKTGTLTLGELFLDAIIDPFDTKLSESVVLSYAQSLERNAVHPIAKAIVRTGQEKKVPFVEVQDVQVIAGYGVEGRLRVNDHFEEAFIGDVGHAVGDFKEKERLFALVSDLQSTGKIVSAFRLKDKLVLLAFSDHPRPKIAKTVASLKEKGFSLLMLTGDSKQNAALISKQVGIERFEGGLKPEDKLSIIENLSEKEGLCMCGDGINDAPALARATVGIAMGGVSSATARAAADVILLHDTIEHLDWLFDKAKQTKRIVRQNLVIALTAIICGSIPALWGVLPLWLAVIVHEGGTVLVGLNAMRLLRN